MTTADIALRRPDVDLSPETLAEVEAGYRCIVQLLVPLASDQVEETVSPERKALWCSAHALVELLELAFIPHDLDLTKGEDEDTRRALHAFIVWRHFTPHPLGDLGWVDIPKRSAKESQLEVYYMHGHWFASWLKLGEQAIGAMECDLRELMSFDHRPEERRLILVEVP